MNIQELTQFFMWCTIMNGGLLLLWAILATGAPETVYRLQSKWFPMTRETFNVIFYVFIGVFKILVILFNIVPLLALLIMG